MLPAGSSWKLSAKARWQVVRSIWMPAVLIVWPNKISKFLSIHYPAGFLMLVYLLEIDSPLVALMLFWSPPYLHLLKNPNRQPLLICTRCHTQDNPAEMYAEFTSSMSTWGRHTSLRLDTVKVHGLDTSRKQHEVSCKRLKAKKFILHTILFGVGGSILPHTLWITLKSSALIHKKPIRLPSSYMLILCSMHTNWQLLNALLKNLVALKVLIWSRGRLLTLQIATISSFSLVEETLRSNVSFFPLLM